MSRRIDRFLYQKEKSIGERILLFPLYLLSLPYGGAVRARSLLYSLELLRTKTLPCPVISVGNITVGGTGKTPLVMALAKGLMDRGIPMAILSRGYKGKKTSEPVVSDGKTIFLSPEESGDEPFLMAKACKGTPVLVGKDRFVNGRIALQRFGVKGCYWMMAISIFALIEISISCSSTHTSVLETIPSAERDSEGTLISPS